MSKAKEKALRLAKRANKHRKAYARGGDVDINDTFDPTEGGNIPRAIQQKIRQVPRTWTSSPQRYAEGGETPDFTERWYDRALGDSAQTKPPYGMAKALFREGKSRPGGADKDWSAYGSFGELKGTAPEDTPTAYPTKSGVNITEGDIDRGMNVGMGSGPGIMVGKFGANMLRQGVREAEAHGSYKSRALSEMMGDKPEFPTTRLHPVYAKEVEREASQLRPEFRDAYRGFQQDIRDAEAKRVLETREKRWDPSDQDVFKNSGWFRGADGHVRKEIPDHGARLEEALPGKYAINHPAGDLHKTYDIPPIQFKPGLRAGEAEVWPDGRIYLGGNPNSKKGLEDAVSPALHEIQHVIQKREGFSAGANPQLLPKEALDQEFFPNEHPKIEISHRNGRLGAWKIGGDAAEPSWQAGNRYGSKFDAGNIPRNSYGARELVGRQEAYERSAGETEARNVQGRRAKGFRYHEHPENTEDRTRGVQWHDTQHIPPSREETLDKVRSHMIRKAKEDRGWRGVLDDAMDPANDSPRKAGGGSVGNFNPERAAAYGLAKQGMIKSNIPGRTDKINMHVPTGSYIIPADIPSAIGEGNSDAGSAILNKMFNKGPYGMNLPKKKGGMRVGSRKASLSMSFAEGGDTRNSDILRDMMTRPKLSERMRSQMGDAQSITLGFPNQRAEGGQVDDATPIIAAGGEYVLHPDTVLGLGGGDIDLGHAILDDFVKQVRSKHIKTLEGLKPPKGSE